MPLTLSHPAALAVLPRSFRRHLPLAALAIGSMSPDFEYLLRMRAVGSWSHSLPGLVTFCLPVGLLVWTVWEYVARVGIRQVFALAPGRPRLPWTIRTVAVAGVGVLVGAVTHLAWDAFTHAGRFGATLVPGIESELTRIGGYSLRWFGLLQHLSTIVGALVICLWYARERDRDGIPWTVRSAGVLAASLAVGAALGLLNALVFPQLLGEGYNPGRIALLARFIIGAMVGAAVSLFAYGALRTAETVGDGGMTRFR